jgi:hypothetical protein
MGYSISGNESQIRCEYISLRRYLATKRHEQEGGLDYPEQTPAHEAK